MLKGREGGGGESRNDQKGAGLDLTLLTHKPKDPQNRDLE